MCLVPSCEVITVTADNWHKFKNKSMMDPCQANFHTLPEVSPQDHPTPNGRFERKCREVYQFRKRTISRVLSVILSGGAWGAVTCM
eukprot:5281238-Amphidinium_carterae.1